MLRAMSCSWFYSESGSDYVAVGSTVTGNNKFVWFISLFWILLEKPIHPVKTCEIDCRKIAFEQELAFYRPVFLQSSCSDSAECKFEKIRGFQNICHSAIGGKQASKRPIPVQRQSFNSRFCMSWLGVCPRKGFPRRIQKREINQNNLLFPVTVLPTAT